MGRKSAKAGSPKGLARIYKPLALESGHYAKGAVLMKNNKYRPGGVVWCYDSILNGLLRKS